MKPNLPTKTIVVAVAVLLMAMSMAVMADHVPEDKDSHKDEGKGKYTYIGMGIGDHIVICLPKETPGVDINEVNVTVYNPLSDNPKEEDGDVLISTGTIKVPGGPIIVPPQDLTDGENICLGGAFNDEVENTSTAAEGHIPEEWRVWAIDEVYETVKGLGGPDIVPSGFATIRVVATESQGLQKEDCVPDDTWTQVCVGDTGTTSAGKIISQFSFCGTGGVNDIADPDWGAIPKPDFDPDTFTVTKAVFLDGPIFYALDCGLTGTGAVGGIWSTVADEWNNSPLCDPLGVCIVDELPGGDAECWDGTGGNDKGPGPDHGDWQNRGNHESGIATIGQIGWSNDFGDDMDCSEPQVSGGWTTSQPSPTVFIQNFPVQVTTGSSEDKED